MPSSVEYAKHWDLCKSNLATFLKIQQYNSCVLPAMTYDVENWTLTKQVQNKRAAAQTKMERSTYAQRHIQGQKDQHLGQGEETRFRHNQHCQKNEMVLGRAHQPPQRRPMDLACHHLDTMRQERTTRKTSQAVQRQPGQILEGHDLVEDSARQDNLEIECWGLRPTIQYYGCTMMMMYWYKHNYNT